MDRSLVDIEWKLRRAQAHEALESLQHNLQARAYLYKFKDRFVRGQHANTRARNAIASVDAQIREAAEDYRAAYKALVSLCSVTNDLTWQRELLPLADDDIRDLSESKAERMGKKVSEGKRTISWIWRMVPAENLENDDLLRDRK